MRYKAQQNMRKSLRCVDRWLEITKVGCILFMVQPLIAQETIKLSLRDSVDLALKNNLYLKSAQLNTTTAESKASQVDAARNPRLNVAVIGSQQTLVAQNLLAAASYTNTYAQVSTTKMLFPSRDQRHATLTADADTKIAKTGEKKARNELILSAKAQYWKVVNLYSLKALEENNLETYKRIFEIERAKEQYGFGFKLDRQWAATQVGLAQDSLSEAERDLLIAESQFRQMLLLPEGVPMQLTDQLPITLVKATDLANRAAAIEYQAEIEIAEMSVRKKDIDKRFAKKRLLPNFSVSATYNNINAQSASISLDDAWNLSLQGDYPIQNDLPIFYQNNYFFGFRCSYDLYDGSQARSDLNFAQAALESEINKLQATKATITDQFIQDRITLKNTINRWSSLKDVNLIASENVKAANARFRGADIPLTKLLSIETDHIDVERKELDAFYQLNVAAETIKKDLLLEEYVYE